MACRHLASTGQTGTVEPVVLVAVGLILVALYLWAARQVAMGRRRLIWVLSAPPLLGLLVMLWAAFRVWAASPLAGIGLVAIGVPSILLNVRRIRRQASGPAEDEGAGELPSADFDYIIWVAIGMPFVLVVLLMLLLVTGGLSSTD